MKKELYISVNGMSHSYGTKKVLHDIDFTVSSGSITGYLGPNGAGKSTTLKILSGLIDPTCGDVLVSGEVPSSLESRRLLGYLPDDGGLYSLLSPSEHFALVCDLYDLRLGQVEKRQADLVEMFGVEEILNNRIDTLSKGQKQRVALVCCLLHDPKVLLLDEPLNGLDVLAVQKLRQELKRMSENGAAILYCSHLLDVVERLCDKTIVLMNGSIVANDTTDNLIQQSTDGTLESAFRSLSSTAESDVKNSGKRLDSLGD